jgi:organic hydroperoxide reductase OsmC/OhrA
MEAAVKPKAYHYTNALRWSGEKKGVLEAAGKPDLGVASPPEFKGHPGIWSPPDLLVAAVNGCTMTTFLTFAARKDIAISSYECAATGTLEMVDGVFRFSRIDLSPRIVVKRREDRNRALEVFLEAESSCLVNNSLLTRVEAAPEVMVEA